MVRAFATGYGYDKRSAAIAAAVERLAPGGDPDFPEPDAVVVKLQSLQLDGGNTWDRALRDAGFALYQVV